MRDKTTDETTSNRATAVPLLQELPVIMLDKVPVQVMPAKVSEQVQPHSCSWSHPSSHTSAGSVYPYVP